VATSRLGFKITAAFLAVVLILSALTMYSLAEGRKTVIESTGTDSIHMAEFIASALDRTIYLKYHELLMKGGDSVIQAEIGRSNSEYENLSDPYAYMDAIDSEWSSTPLTELSPLMEVVLANNASVLLAALCEHYIHEHGLSIYSWVAVTNRYGAVVAMSDRTESFSQEDEGWWQNLTDAGYYFGNIEEDALTGTHGLLAGVAIRNETGDLSGTIFAFLDIVSVAEEALYLGETYQTTEMRVVTPDGRLVFSSGVFDMLEDVSDEDFFIKATDQNGYFITTEHGQEKLFSYAHASGYFQYNGNDLIVFVDHQTSEVLSAVEDLNDRVMSAFVLLIGLSVVMSLVSAMSISARVRRLASAAGDFSSGNLTKRIDDHGSDEIAQLARALNGMAAELDDLYKGLETRVQLRTKELEQATRKLHLLGSITRHDSLNQVTVISAWASVLEESVHDEKGREVLAKMKEAARNLESYLVFTGTYEQIGVKRPEWIEMGVALTTNLFGLDLQGARFHKGLDGIEVYADPMLPKVFRNLVDNSVRHGGTVNNISFTYEETPEGLLIVYEDDGTGIPPGMKDGIFERKTIAGRRSFGLYLSKEILAITGITVREVGESGRGARFEILVPKGGYRFVSGPGGGSTART
jgi:signal transduction histidine kinase